jgi:acetolactate synthase-1/2/3 large subunit
VEICSMRASRAIAEILKMEGVEFVSYFPHPPLIYDLVEVGIRRVCARQERVAVNIADGYTRVSGKPGVALVAGVGVENAFSGVSQAFADLVPMLILAGQRPRHRLGTRTTQDLDALFSLHKVTKWAERINYADRVPEFMRRAFTYLRTGRPSPVFLEIPSDVASEEIGDSDFNYRPAKGWRTAGDPDDVRVAARALLAAESPLIYAGEGVLYAGAWDELRELAEIVQAPVMTTMKAKSAFPENHQLSVGNGGLMGTKMAAHFLRKADLIFSIGASLTKGPGATIPVGEVIVQSTIDELDINKDYMADFIIIGDAKLVLRQLNEEVKERGSRAQNEALMDEIARVKREFLQEWMGKLTSDEVPINPYRVIWDFMHAVDRDETIVFHDAGLPRSQLAPFYEAIIPRGYIGWGHHSTLGYSLGGAIGGRLAEPDKLVANFMGDAAFGMVGLDFETAVREKTPILTILLNNSGMGIYHPRSFPLSGDYAKVAEGLGGYSERVDDPDEIIPSLKRAKKALDSGRPALLDVITKIEPETTIKYWV